MTTRNILLNALTLNALHELFDYLDECNLSIRKLQIVDMPFDNCISYIGHKDLVEIVKNEAAKFGKSVNINFNRESYKYSPGDVLYIIQYIGDRLPEGTKELPANAKLKYFKVTVNR